MGEGESESFPTICTPVQCTLQFIHSFVMHSFIPEHLLSADAWGDQGGGPCPSPQGVHSLLGKEGGPETVRSQMVMRAVMEGTLKDHGRLPGGGDASAEAKSWFATTSMSV